MFLFQVYSSATPEKWLAKQKDFANWIKHDIAQLSSIFSSEVKNKAMDNLRWNVPQLLNNLKSVAQSEPVKTAIKELDAIDKAIKSGKANNKMAFDATALVAELDRASQSDKQQKGQSNASAFISTSQEKKEKQEKKKNILEELDALRDSALTIVRQNMTGSIVNPIWTATDPTKLAQLKALYDKRDNVLSNNAYYEDSNGSRKLKTVTEPSQVPNLQKDVDELKALLKPFGENRKQAGTEKNEQEKDATKQKAEKKEPYKKISWDSKVKLLPIDSMPQEFKDFTDWLATKFLDPDGGERFSRKQLNTILTGVLEYMQGKGWISEDEKKRLAFDAEKTALLKSIFAVWTGRTEKIAKATFDRMQDTDNKPFSVHEVLSHLRYIGEDDVATSQVVQGWQQASGPEKIKTAKAETFWKGIVFKKTTEGIDLSAASDKKLLEGIKIKEEMASGKFSEATAFLALPIVQDALKAAGVENTDANWVEYAEANAKSGEFYSVANLTACVQGDLQKKFEVVPPSENDYLQNESYKNLSNVLDAIGGTGTLQTLKDLGYVELNDNGNPVLVYSTTNKLVGKGVLSSAIFGTKRSPKGDSEIAGNEDVRSILLSALKDQFASLYPSGQEGRTAAIGDLGGCISGGFNFNALVQDPSKLVDSKQAILDAAKPKVPGVVSETPTPASLEELAFSNLRVLQALYYNADNSLKPKEEVDGIKSFIKDAGFTEPKDVLNAIEQYYQSKQEVTPGLTEPLETGQGKQTEQYQTQPAELLMSDLTRKLSEAGQLLAANPERKEEQAYKDLERSGREIARDLEKDYQYGSEPDVGSVRGYVSEISSALETFKAGVQSATVTTNLEQAISEATGLFSQVDNLLGGGVPMGRPLFLAQNDFAIADHDRNENSIPDDKLEAWTAAANRMKEEYAKRFGSDEAMQSVYDEMLGSLAVQMAEVDKLLAQGSERSNDPTFDALKQQRDVLQINYRDEERTSFVYPSKISEQELSYLGMAIKRLDEVKTDFKFVVSPADLTQAEVDAATGTYNKADQKLASGTPLGTPLVFAQNDFAIADRARQDTVILAEKREEWRAAAKTLVEEYNNAFPDEATTSAEKVVTNAFTNVSTGADLVDLSKLGQASEQKQITNIFTTEGNSELKATLSTGIAWLDAAGSNAEVIAAYNNLPEKTRAGLLETWANKVSADPDSAPVSPEALPELIKNLK